jgi:hypothetical protein
MDVLISDRKLTLQLFCEMANFFLVVVIGMSGALQVKFKVSEFLQSLPHLFFYVLNLVIEGGDLGSKKHSGHGLPGRLHWLQLELRLGWLSPSPKLLLGRHGSLLQNQERWE